LDGDAGLLRSLPNDADVLPTRRANGHEALAEPLSQRVIVSHLYDLAALALGAQCGSAAFDGNRTVRSVRYLHKLFQNEGITYSVFVLGQRLARAYGILRSPLQARRAISTIAFELGFNDLSYFNRAFRRRYHATPSDVRNGATTRTQLF
jgi:methylphosphotriester-DNA--protein-cysteine methyltransferase